jgi:hypothetical protein
MQTGILHVETSQFFTEPDFEQRRLGFRSTGLRIASHNRADAQSQSTARAWRA